jgi:hypothetical protein
MPDILTNPGTITAALTVSILFTVVVWVLWMRKSSESICVLCGAERHTILRRTTHGLIRGKWVASDIYVTHCGTPDCSAPPKSTIVTRAATKEEIEAIVAR